MSPTQLVDSQWVRDNFSDLTHLTSLDSGGQKQVFMGTHPTDGAVVIKLVDPGQDVERALREILAVERLQSPRVPRIFEYGNVTIPSGASVVWVREQRIDGSSIRSVLQCGVLPSNEVLKLGLHVLEVLARAEQRLIVHRDVKPENIMRDAQGDYWLLDFGLARHLELTSLTATAQYFGCGTPGYAPPEQCRNLKRDIDGRTDLFALGVTLYESATGTNPFRAGARDFFEILRRVESSPALPPLIFPIHDQAAFRDLVVAMTSKRRHHRPRTVAEALSWMQDICAREGIQ